MDFELKSSFFEYWILILEPEKYRSLTGNHSNNLSLDSLGTKGHLIEAIIPIAARVRNPKSECQIQAHQNEKWKVKWDAKRVRFSKPRFTYCSRRVFISC